MEVDKNTIGAADIIAMLSGGGGAAMFGGEDTADLLTTLEANGMLEQLSIELSAEVQKVRVQIHRLELRSALQNVRYWEGVVGLTDLTTEQRLLYEEQKVAIAFHQQQLLALGVN